MEVCSVNCEKCKESWNKTEHDSRYLVYECNNRIGDLLSLPFCKKNIVTCLIIQTYVVIYLGKSCCFVFDAVMVLGRHL